MYMDFHMLLLHRSGVNYMYQLMGVLKHKEHVNVYIINSATLITPTSIILFRILPLSTELTLWAANFVSKGTCKWGHYSQCFTNFCHSDTNPKTHNILLSGTTLLVHKCQQSDVIASQQDFLFSDARINFACLR